MLKHEPLSLATDGSGNGTAQTARAISGIIHSFDWYGSGLAAGADLVISLVDTGAEVDKTLLTLTDAANSNKEYFARTLEQSNVGGDLATYTEYVVMGKIKAVIAQGGATNTAKLIVYYYSP